MAHRQQQDFVRAVKAAFPVFFIGQRVLEIGSLDINGTIREHFADCAYTGLDVGAGPGVDVVCQGQDYAAPDASFDTVISCEVMEHNPHWRETFANMVRLCRPGGLVLMTCASLGRPEHGTTRTTKADAPLITWEYYKNLTPEDFKGAINFHDDYSVFEFFENVDSRDTYFIGFKIGAPPPENAVQAAYALRRHYYWENLRHFKALLRRARFALFGEDAYQARRLKARKN
ncbi:MAG: methyltransferase domain-containing protein [Acidocella sp.]|nr:methyltransferase domain-containing protein [Acidocella sp.]